MRISLLLLGFLTSMILAVNVQAQYWQQFANYRMEVDFDVKTHSYQAVQHVEYVNNSPDTLDKLYFHLYLNAFQPGSMMDVLSRNILDPDPRIGNKIAGLKANEIGYQKVHLVKQGSKSCSFFVDETILEVSLHKAIPPGSKTHLRLEYEAQVPLQIRRNGRNNEEGIDYSMAQWYPKVCAYDRHGWHTDPYVSKEFYGPFGNYDVRIAIDPNYILAGTGIPDKKHKDAKTLWHFRADHVHDFVWAADPDFIIEKQIIDNGPVIQYVFQPDENYRADIDLLKSLMPDALVYAKKHFGKYPYPVFSFIQGGDGGMEYPMATLMTFYRPPGSFLGTAFHELIHSWYYAAVANDELSYGWMDEGFSDFATDKLWSYLVKQDKIPNARKHDRFARLIRDYVDFKKQDIEEVLSLHADHFLYNYSYYQGNYMKAEVFMIQLEYMLGEKVFRKAMLDYFDQWKFKHPEPEDFIRVMEKSSGLNLDWYVNYWIHTTRSIDYSIDSIMVDGQKQMLELHLSNAGTMPMPVDILIEYDDGEEQLYTIPLRIMRGAKDQGFQGMNLSILDDWPWTHPTYTTHISIEGKQNVKRVVIDPFTRVADINRYDNSWTFVAD